MKEMKQKSKRVQIYRIEYKLPLKPSYKDGNHQFPNSKGQQPKLKVSQWQKNVLSLKPRQFTNSPLKLRHMDGKHQVPNSRG
jgi:hypothetical protein